MGCVSRVVKMHYWQPYRLAPLKISWPPFGLPTQKSWRRHCYPPCFCHSTHRRNGPLNVFYSGNVFKFFAFKIFFHVLLKTFLMHPLKVLSIAAQIQREAPHQRFLLMLISFCR